MIWRIILALVATIGVTGGAPSKARTAPTCFYKNVYYTQGQSWNDGCSQSCTCYDASTGAYSCREVCLSWKTLPGLCTMEEAPPGLCCEQPKCPTHVHITIPKGYEKEYPGYPIYDHPQIVG